MYGALHTCLSHCGHHQQRALAAVDAQEEEAKAERAQATQRAAAQAEQAQADKVAARAAWSTEEVRLLHKGIDKFPVVRAGV